MNIFLKIRFLQISYSEYLYKKVCYTICKASAFKLYVRKQFKIY